MQYGLTMLEEAGIEIHYVENKTIESTYITKDKEVKNGKVLDFNETPINGGYYEDGKCNLTGNSCSSSYSKKFLKDEPCHTCEICIKTRLECK